MGWRVRCLLIHLSLMMFCLCSRADFPHALLQLEVPVLSVTTVNGELPSCDYVSAPAGCDGNGIVNATKIPGRLYIIQKGDTLYDSGEYVEGSSGMTIRIRGNSSAQAAKKPYKIKLQRKADLLCRGDERYYDKEWVLLAKNDLDLFTGTMVSHLLDMPWTPSFCYINVVINDQYAGLYQLVENVCRNADCRLDVDRRTGFIAERDAYWWNTDFSLQSSLSRYRYTLKYPDSDDMTVADSVRIQYRLLQMEQSIIDGTYTRYIDTENFAAWMLSHDIVGTPDAGGSNMYLTRHDDLPSTLIQMPVLWDFDAIMWRDGRWAASHTDAVTLFPYLFASSNRTFVRAYIAHWNAVKDIIEETLTDELRSFAQSALGRDVAESFRLDAERGHYNNLWTFYVDHACDWFRDRTAWLTDAIAEMEGAETSIGTPMCKSADKLYYNLSGQRVPHNHRGIVVCGGRKYLSTK